MSIPHWDDDDEYDVMLTENDDNHPLPMDEEFDKDGDVEILTADHRRFRVSSNIMGLISPAFKAMLTSPLREGSFARSKQKPLLLRLFHDDDEALRILMGICHFSTWITTFAPSYEQLGDLARLADKYLCRHVIAPQCNIWLAQYPIPEIVQTTDLDILARVAYKLDNGAQFARITKSLIQNFTDASLEADVDSRLLRSLVRKERLSLLVRMQVAIDDIVGQLRYYSQRFKVMDASDSAYHICLSCEEENDDWDMQTGVPRCTSCGKEHVQEMVCNAAQYFKHMTAFLQERTHLWPVSEMTNWPPADAANRDLVDDFEEWNGHRGCEIVGRDCPMYRKLCNLKGELKDLYDEVKGIDLEDFKSDVLFAAW
ncbi:hypothetical protein MMC10_007834 [Thelotrema lepadinum]|nr:hypothetical protein [Thelotrema lepadinum]